MLATKLLRLPERENEDTRRIAKLERQLAAAREAVKVEKAANAAMVRERERAAGRMALEPVATLPGGSSRAERLLEVAIGVLRERPPAGVEAAYIDGFVGRNRTALLGIMRGAFGGG